MSSEFNEVQVSTIILVIITLIIKYNSELEETLNDFYQTE